MAAASTLDRLSLYLGTCTKLWIGVYLTCCLILSIRCFMFHVTFIGLFLCVLSYFRLPAAEPSEAFKILGRDPLNLDGSPSRSTSRGVLGLIAHRAAPLDAPENTLKAIHKAKKSGAKTIYCDLTFTSDGQAFALRPSHLNELNKDVQSKEVSSMTSKEVSNLDVASNHPLKDEFSPAYPPKIEEVLETIQNEDLKLILDVALPYPMSLEILVDYIINEIFAANHVKNKNLYSKVVLTSSWPHVIYAIRQRNPRIVSGLVWKPRLLRETFPKSYSTWINYAAWLGDNLLSWAIHEFLWYFLGIAFIMVCKHEIHAPYVQAWRSKGIRVISSPVNKSLERLYFEKHLRISCMADTMDEIGIDKLLEEEN